MVLEGICRIMIVELYLALDQGQKKILRTEVALGSHQHGNLKNNVFIFHRMIRKLLNRMQMTRGDHHDVSLRYAK